MSALFDRMQALRVPDSAYWDAAFTLLDRIAGRGVLHGAPNAPEAPGRVASAEAARLIFATLLYLFPHGMDCLGQRGALQLLAEADEDLWQSFCGHPLEGVRTIGREMLGLGLAERERLVLAAREVLEDHVREGAADA